VIYCAKPADPMLIDEVAQLRGKRKRRDRSLNGAALT
jgi:hypothetical protein